MYFQFSCETIWVKRCLYQKDGYGQKVQSDSRNTIMKKK